MGIIFQMRYYLSALIQRSAVQVNVVLVIGLPNYSLIAIMRKRT